MARPRFLTAREVFEAFPKMADAVRAAPTGDAPVAYLRALASSETPEDALTFCAFALPRREAVWWGCQCVRTLGSMRPGEEDACLRAAEAWVREPDDERRRAAFQLGSGSDQRFPTAWLALAAAGSPLPGEGAGGQLAGDQTPRGVANAILIALAKVGAKDRAHRLSVCVDGGASLLEQEVAAA